MVPFPFAFARLNALQAAVRHSNNKANVIAEIVSANVAAAIDRAIAINRANMANEADEASLAEANESLTNGSIAVVVKLVLLIEL